MLDAGWIDEVRALSRRVFTPYRMFKRWATAKSGHLRGEIDAAAMRGAS